MSDFAPSAKVIADSVHHENRITSMEIGIHRFMLPALNTHRAISKSSASHRAIPARKQLDRAVYEPAVPLIWAAEQKGMQGGPVLRTEDAQAAREIWLQARDEAVTHAAKLAMIGVHKSIVNRLIEPFLGHTVIVTATEWDNFFEQRRAPQDGRSPLAQAEIVAVAEAMHTALKHSVPMPLAVNHWHLPYLDDEELQTIPVEQAARISAARCARVSYLTHDGKRDLQADLDLYHRLVTAKPPHWSPLEHVATPAQTGEIVRGNFIGWHQLRHTVALDHVPA